MTNTPDRIANRRRGEHHKLLFREALEEYRLAIISGDSGVEQRMKVALLRSFDSEVDTANGAM